MNGAESVPISFFIVAIFAIGMAISFLIADRNSPTSRALSTTLALIGVTMLVNVPLDAGLAKPARAWVYLFSLLEASIIISSEEWALRIAKTAMLSRPGSLARVIPPLRTGQALAVVYGILGLVLPQVRVKVWQQGKFEQPGFYVFAVPFFVSLTLAVVALIQLVRGQIEPSERVRLRALGAATPFLAATTLIPEIWKPAAIAIGETVFLAGAVRYHVMQGRRGEFLARFLSPQLARLVRERGLGDTMHQNRVQLSVIACDLRGFTAFADSAAPEDVMQFLRDYYQTVGQVVTDLGGSILNFAGDGIVSLVGAPLPLADHAERAVRIALEIRTRFGEMQGPWQRLGLQLGLGIGVASGFVTVGTIASPDHLEYTAVGPTVNLAARLSSRAESRQVLVDHRTVGLTGENNPVCAFADFGSADLKGFARPVAIFSADRLSVELTRQASPQNQTSS